MHYHDWHNFDNILSTSPHVMKTTTITAIAVLLSINLFAQTTRVVRPGQYNVPITEVQFEHNGTTITQTSILQNLRFDLTEKTACHSSSNTSL